MMAPQGYVPALRLFFPIEKYLLHDGMVHLEHRVLSSFENAESMGGEELGSRLRGSSEERKKIQTNAYYCALHVFLNLLCWHRPEALLMGRETPYMRVPLKVLRSNLRLSTSALIENAKGLISEKEAAICRASPVEAFIEGIWGKAIYGEQALFRPLSPHDAITSKAGLMDSFTVINVTESTLDLSALRATVKLIDALREIDDLTEGSGVTLGELASPHSAMRAKVMLEQLSHWDQAPIFFGEEDFWQLASRLGLEEETLAAGVKAKEPHELLIEEFEQAPCTKDEMKARLYPEMSGREFDYQWRRATEVCPEMSKPGRKG